MHQDVSEESSSSSSAAAAAAASRRIDNKKTLAQTLTIQNSKKCASFMFISRVGKRKRGEFETRAGRAKKMAARVASSSTILLAILVILALSQLADAFGFAPSAVRLLGVRRTGVVELGEEVAAAEARRQERRNSNLIASVSSSSSCSSRKRSQMTMMAASRGGGGGGGSTKLDNKTKQDVQVKPTYRDEIEKDYRLILHDDTVHTIQQVCEILGASCPLCSGPRAYEVTLEVHMTGAGTVAVANKKIIDEYCKSLQMAGLSVSMAPDDDFEGADGEE